MSVKRQSQGKWHHKGKSLGWSKDDGQIKRRRAALASRRGNYLKAARALQSLSNISQDRETVRKARADSAYFFMMHRKTGK